MGMFKTLTGEVQSQGKIGIIQELPIGRFLNLQNEKSPLFRGLNWNNLGKVASRPKRINSMGIVLIYQGRGYPALS